MSHVNKSVPRDVKAYGIVPTRPANRAGAGVPPNISETFF